MRESNAKKRVAWQNQAKEKIIEEEKDEEAEMKLAVVSRKNYNAEHAAKRA